MKYPKASTELNAVLDVARAAVRLRLLFPDFVPGNVFHFLDNAAADWSQELLEIVMDYEWRDDRRGRAIRAVIKRLDVLTRDYAQRHRAREICRQIMRAGRDSRPPRQRDRAAIRRRCPRIKAVADVSAAHGDAFADAWVRASEDNLTLLGIVSATGVIEWPDDDQSAESTHHYLAQAILRQTLSLAQPAVALAFVEATRDVFAVEPRLIHVTKKSRSK